MNLLNREQLASLWLGIMAIAIMGLIPPWREAAGNGNPLAYAPLNSPPTVQSPLGVTIDYSRLSVEWTLAAVITAGLLASFQKVASLANNDAGKQKQINSSGAKSSSLKSSPDGAERAFSGSGIVENSAAGRSASTSRTLSFPKVSMGDLLVESDEDDEYWEFFSQASGIVSIPAGRRIQLELIKGAHGQLTALRDLPADAFYSLDLSGSPLSDTDLENVRHFTELHELDLSDTSVSDLGIKSLSGLSKLQKIWLDNTRVTDKGLEELSNHRELEKISLVGTQIKAPDAQSLVKAFPHKCELVLEENG